MTVRNLDGLLAPRSVVAIGASDRPGSVGAAVTRNLLSAGFPGRVMLVNPNRDTVAGQPAFRDVAGLPEAPDLAVVMTPPDTVPGLIDALGARGTRAAIVISAGFGETAAGEQRASGAALRQQMLEAARPHLLRIVGPNCVGVLSPGAGLNASFAHLTPSAGRIAFVAQSGAVIVSALDWAASRGIGFSHIVSLGDMADVDFGDMLDYLASDRSTRAILLYVESVTQPRKFMSAARVAARAKPVIVVKAGRFEAGARAAASHTGALAGADPVYDAAFRRAGMLRVRALSEMFDAVETLDRMPGRAASLTGNRLAILTNGGGLGVLAADALTEGGGEVANLSAETLVQLDAALPANWSHANPVDIVGDAPGERYRVALEALLADRNSDAVLVINCPTAIASSDDAAVSVLTACGGDVRPAKPVLTSWVGSASVEGARQRFHAAGVPTYVTPEDAVRAFLNIVDYARNQAALRTTPPSLPKDDAADQPDAHAAREVVHAALAAGREWLAPDEVEAVMAQYGIPTVETRFADSVEKAGEIAAAMFAAEAREAEAALVLKIVSPDIVHKSEVGGVVMDLRNPEMAVLAAEGMAARIARLRPEARIDGFILQPQVRRHPDSHELIVGIFADPQFGPMLMFGQGGTAVELIRDTAFALPPLDTVLTRELVARTRVSRLLGGHRGRPGIDMGSLERTLIRLSRLACEVGEIQEVDINPLIADPRGVIGLDVRVRVRSLAAGVQPQDRLAVLPYPRELEQDFEALGRTFRLRPVRPEDEPAFIAGFARLRPEDIRMRFFMPMARLDHDLAARLTQIDYDREMAFVLVEPRDAGTDGIIIRAVVRLISSPDGERGEFSLVVDPEIAGHGVGRRLLEHAMDYGRRRGMEEIWGDVLVENARMRSICAELGYAERHDIEDPALVRVSRRLTV